MLVMTGIYKRATWNVSQSGLIDAKFSFAGVYNATRKGPSIRCAIHLKIETFGFEKPWSSWRLRRDQLGDGAKLSYRNFIHYSSALIPNMESVYTFCIEMMACGIYANLDIALRR